MPAEGTYKGVPTRAVLGMTSTGKEQIAVEFDFLEMPGTKLTWYGFFTDQTFDRTIQALRDCGWTGTDLGEFSSGTLPPGMDKQVELVVKVEEYPAGSGQMRDKIAFVNSSGGLMVKTALSPDKAMAFAARMKGRIAAFDKKVASAPPAAKKQAKVEDSPF